MRFSLFVDVHSQQRIMVNSSIPTFNLAFQRNCVHTSSAVNPKHILYQPYRRHFHILKVSTVLFVIIFYLFSYSQIKLNPKVYKKHLLKHLAKPLKGFFGGLQKLNTQRGFQNHMTSQPPFDIYNSLSLISPSLLSSDIFQN